MGLFNKEQLGDKYHAPDKAQEWAMSQLSDEALEKYANDPNCIEQDKCAVHLAQRKATRAANAAYQQKLRDERDAARSTKRDELTANPFDPRTEVSADAQHIASRIVKHLWILFVLLPIIMGVLLALTGLIK